MTKETKCCEKCKEWSGAYKSVYDCYDPNCECHTPPQEEDDKKCEHILNEMLQCCSKCIRPFINGKYSYELDRFETPPNDWRGKLSLLLSDFHLDEDFEIEKIYTFLEKEIKEAEERGYVNRGVIESKVKMGYAKEAEERGRQQALKEVRGKILKFSARIKKEVLATLLQEIREDNKG